MNFLRLLSKYFLPIAPFLIATFVVSIVWLFSRLNSPNDLASSPSPSSISPIPYLSPSNPSLLPSPQPTSTLAKPSIPTPNSTSTPLTPPLLSPSPFPISPIIKIPVSSQPKSFDTPYHFAYAENKNNLVKVGNYYDRKEYLDQEAAEAFMQMKASAQQLNIKLKIISGFRTIDSQRELFHKQIQRKGGEKRAKKYSAPPGYSEHHTGYALDTGDETQPETDLKLTFQNTEAYTWLEKNASNYGFELSFPENNFQGVSFEPWHWRFVGSAKAQIIFEKARSY